MVFNKILEPTGPLPTTRASQRPKYCSPLFNKILTDLNYLSQNPVLGVLPPRLLGLWIEICWQGAQTIKNVHQWYVANPWLWDTFHILSNRRRKSARLRNFLIGELKKLPSPGDCAGWAFPFTEPCTITEVDGATGKPLKQVKRDHHWVLLLPWSSNRPVELLDSLGKPRPSLVKTQEPAIPLIQELTEQILVEKYLHSPISPDKKAYFISIIQQWKLQPVQVSLCACMVSSLTHLFHSMKSCKVILWIVGFGLQYKHWALCHMGSL